MDTVRDKLGNVEHVAAGEPDISPGSRWRPKSEPKESDYLTRVGKVVNIFTHSHVYHFKWPISTVNPLFGAIYPINMSFK